MLLQENQDEITMLNESRDLLKDIEEEIPHQEKTNTPTQKSTIFKVTPTEKVQSEEKTDTPIATKPSETETIQEDDEEIDNQQISFFSNDNDFHEDVFSNIIVGTRLSVYWEEDNQSYPCKVDSFNNFSDLKYDDGQEEIVDLKKVNFKILTQKTTNAKTIKSSSKKKKLNKNYHAIIMMENLFLEPEEDLKEILVRKDRVF